jgi:signal transduction protein with GAF and PtsI domain
MSQPTDFDQRLLEIYGELDRDRLMDLVVNYARDRLNAGGSSIFLRDGITGRYVLRATTGLLESGEMPNERIEYEVGEGLTGWIAKHGTPLCIPNVQDRSALRRIAKDLIWSKKFTEISPQPHKAYLGVPILARNGDTVLGVLRVSGGDHFDAQDEVQLKNVAAMVCIAIENSQRFEQEKRRARYFKLLVDINSELDPRRPVSEMLSAVAQRVRKGFRTEACLIYLRSEEDVHRMALRAASGLPETEIGRLEYTVGEGLTGHIVQDGRPIQARESAAMAMWNDPHVAEIAGFLPSATYRSFVGVPLQLGDEILGSLELVNKIPSAPGHRDWFTGDDEGYLSLLSTAIGGVLEGARYLKALGNVGVTAMRMQQVASLGTLAQRILHETANPLAAARLATTNLRASMQNGPKDSPGHEKAINRLDKIEGSLDEVSDKLFNLLTFSQRIGFIRTATDWNDVVRGALIWLVAERHLRNVEVHANYADLPPISIEPNETFGVVATMVRLAIEAFEKPGGLIEVTTSAIRKGRCVHTEICACQPSLLGTIKSALEPEVGVSEELSPLHFEWALAQDTIASRYRGSLTWKVRKGDLHLLLELPVEE